MEISVYIPNENELVRSALRWGHRKPDVELIHALLGHIVKHEYEPKYILMSPTVWREFRYNTIDLLPISIPANFEDDRVGECMGLPIYVSNKVKDNMMSIMCKDYFCVSSYVNLDGK